MKKLIATICTLFVLAIVFSACGTTGATVNSAGTQATLTAKGACANPMHVNWWYEVRNITNSFGSWNPVGPLHRVDNTQPCADTNDRQLASYTTNVTPDQVYEYRVATQTDGQAVYVCDKNSNCVLKGSAAEANERWDNFQTTPSGGYGETLSEGKDYDQNDASGAVSGAYACDIHSELNKPALAFHDTYGMSQIFNCRNDMSLKLTCKVDMSVFIYPYTFHFFDLDYGNETEICSALAREVVHYSSGEYAGVRADFYLRLNRAGRKWSSGFANKPHRGGCEINSVLVPDYGNTPRSQLHCWAYWGKYSAGTYP